MWILNNTLFVAIASAVGFIIAYRTYGRFLSTRILGLDAQRITPAHTKTDGVDYVPTHPGVLFGHHFASIAGLGPIVGPAIAVMWGWGPALLWVIFGSIFLGAVHDLATLYASLRHEGRGIGDLTDEVIGPRARILFLIIIFFLLALAMGVFTLFMTKLFTDLSPQAVVPTMSLIVIAVLIGLLVYRWKWPLGRVTAIGLLLMFISLFVGLEMPAPVYRMFITDDAVSQAIATNDDPEFPSVAGQRGTRPLPVAEYFEKRAASDPSYAGFGQKILDARTEAMDNWTYVLLAYAFIASVLPVWLLLQPRDYINSYQLYLGLGAILLGLVLWRPQITVAPFATQANVSEPMLPFLFITIACGAISGFHSLVSSGTTVRQIRCESHARLIGYGAMLTEGFLAVLVILACVGGLSGERFAQVYGGSQVDGLGAFLGGAGAIISKPFLWMGGAFNVPEATIVAFSTAFIAVVVVSFAMTTLDSATRLLRFNVEELGKVLRFAPMRNRYVASAIAVVAIGCFAFIKINGQPAGQTLWQLFGTTNQLLAAIGLLVVSIMLYKMGKPIVYTLVPMLLMVASVGWAMVYKLNEFYHQGFGKGDLGGKFLFFVGASLLALSVWLMVEGVLAFRRYHIGRVSRAGVIPA